MKTRSLIARLLIAPVVFINLQCSLLFLFTPSRFAPSFELHDIPGIHMIQGMGLLFLMWNIPYLVALINPQNHFTSLIEAVVMQAIGVIGESILLTSVPSGHSTLQASVIRFIVFDASGLVLLIVAVLITKKNRHISTASPQ